MFHEIRKIAQQAEAAKKNGMKCCLVTVVALEGSAYRRPGVRMLIREDGEMFGAVSGGCVEKEVLRQSRSVFEDGIPWLMLYDGRFRLGCEGQLYILIEPFDPDERFYTLLEKQRLERRPFQISSRFMQSEGAQPAASTAFSFSKGEVFSSHSRKSKSVRDQVNNEQEFIQEVSPAFRLFVVGAEHDAVQLCKYASETGWEVTVVAAPDEQKDASYFPGCEELITPTFEEFSAKEFDEQTAVILMSHSYVKDMRYLLGLKDQPLAYLGLLGPKHRRERLLNEFMEKDPDIPLDFFDRVHGPSGLNIGAETPQEIAISILAEILAVTRRQQPIPLKEKEKGIHS